MDEVVQREAAVQGRHWNAIHGGYFANAAVAHAFVNRILRAIECAKPDVVVDLGGGTGFVLEQLVERGIAPGTRLVDLDESHAQLAASPDSHICPIEASIEAFVRGQLASEGTTCLFIARSVLHYFGQDALPGTLDRIRAQMRPGEWLVHQSACFAEERHAACLNRIFAMMGSSKWCPTVDGLCALLETSGWSVCDTAPAPALPVPASELADRYGLSPDLVARIRKEIMDEFGEIPGVFDSEPPPFVVHFMYTTFACIAR